MNVSTSVWRMELSVGRCNKTVPQCTLTTISTPVFRGTSKWRPKHGLKYRGTGDEQEARVRNDENEGRKQTGRNEKENYKQRDPASLNCYII